MLFDVGQTLLRVQTTVGAVYADTAARHGIEADPEALERSFRVAWKRGLERGRKREHRCCDDSLREDWLEIVRDTFGHRVSPERLPALFEDLYTQFSTADAWSVTPGAREMLTRLRSLGLRLGVLSNWDSRLPGMLDELELRGCFDFLVISYQVGHEKPHRAIFKEGLRRAGTNPAETLHVGDSWEADILPARSLGIRTFWVAPEEERARRENGGPGADRLPEALEHWEELISGRPWNDGGDKPV